MLVYQCAEGYLPEERMEAWCINSQWTPDPMLLSCSNITTTPSTGSRSTSASMYSGSASGSTYSESRTGSETGDNRLPHTQPVFFLEI